MTRAHKSKDKAEKKKRKKQVKTIAKRVENTVNMHPGVFKKPGDVGTCSSSPAPTPPTIEQLLKEMPDGYTLIKRDGNFILKDQWCEEIAEWPIGDSNGFAAAFIMRFRAMWYAEEDLKRELRNTQERQHEILNELTQLNDLRKENKVTFEV